MNYKGGTKIFQGYKRLDQIFIEEGVFHQRGGPEFLLMGKGEDQTNWQSAITYL